MWRCNECGRMFREPGHYRENHGEVFACCPSCKDIDIEPVHLCKACSGHYVSESEEFCDECLEVMKRAVDQCSTALRAEFPNLPDLEILSVMSDRIDELWEANV